MMHKKKQPEKSTLLSKIFIVLAVICIITAVKYGPRWMVGFENYISVTEAKQQIDNKDKILLLDVRTGAEFQAGHMPNAVNMPMKVLQSTLNEDPERFKQRYQNHMILSICLSDARATTAARWLQAEGLNVKVLEGGMSAWRKAALPMVK
jgi:rhodanese-related sulfurtransferase